MVVHKEGSLSPGPTVYPGGGIDELQSTSEEAMGKADSGQETASLGESNGRVRVAG